MSSGNERIVLPQGSGPFIDPDVGRSAFLTMLAELGFSEEDVIRQDSMFADVGVDVPFAPSKGTPTVVRIWEGAVISDGLLVFIFGDGLRQERVPVGGSITNVDGKIRVLFAMRDADNLEYSHDAVGYWRVTVVVPWAKKGMTVEGPNGEATVQQGVVPPLLENMSRSALTLDQLPPITS